MSFKLPKELKKKMENLKDVVDWPSELRAFVKKREGASRLGNS